MRLNDVRRWKTTEKKFNQRYKLKAVKKSKRTRNYKGKFMFLLSKSNLCAVLRFLSKNVCVTETIIVVDEIFTRQISSKYKIPHYRHKRILAQSEVRVTKNFRTCCDKFFGKSKLVTKKIYKSPVILQVQDNEVLTKIQSNQIVNDDVQESRKITPIKILSCKICSQKFLKKELLEAHLVDAHKDEDDEESSGSENELHIDDDVELFLEENYPVTYHSSDNVNHIKKEIKTPVKSSRQYKCLQCSALCGTEETLFAHIERTHPCSSSTSPSQLMGYDFHTNYSKNKPNNSINRKRSLSSTSSSFTSTSKQSSLASPVNEQKTKSQKVESQTKSDFSCKICSTIFDSRKFLNRHIMTLHLSKVFRCYRCNVPFNKKLQLIRHLQTAHLKYKDEDGYIATISDLESVGCYQCCFCKYSSKLKLRVEQHMLNEHYEDFEKGETQDDSISSSPDSLEELLLPETKALRTEDDFYEDQLLTEITPKDDENPFKRRRPANDPSFRYRCGRCLRRFSRSSWLKRHSCAGLGIKIKNEPVEPMKPRLINEVNGFLKCREKTCNKVFTDREYYDLHIKTAH